MGKRNRYKPYRWWYLGLLLACTPILCCAQEFRQLDQSKEIDLGFRRPFLDWTRKEKFAKIIAKLDSANLLIESQPATAEQLALSTYKQSKAAYFYVGIAKSLGTLALLQEKRSNFDSALALYQLAIPYTTRSQNNLIHVIYLRMAIIYESKGNYEKALDYDYQAMDAMKTYHLTLTNMDSATLFHNIALIWQTLGETTKALQYLALLKTVAFHGKSPDALLQYHRMMLHLNPGLSDSQTLAGHATVLDLARAIHNVDAQGTTLNNLCIFFINRNLADSARFYLKQLDALINDNKGLRDFHIFLADINRGRILQVEGQYKEAEQILEKVLRKASSVQFQNMVQYMEPYLADLYYIRGKYSNAYVQLKSATAFYDSVLRGQRTRTVDNWNKTRILEKDRELLQKQLFITTQHKALQQKNFWILSAIVLAIFLGILLMIFRRSYRHKQKLQQGTIQQLQHTLQIDHLKAQVRGEEHERNRIATELHDSIASQVWAIKLNLDEVLKVTDTHSHQKQHLQSIYGHLDEVAQEIRKTAHYLMPALLLEEGLLKAISALCQRVENNSSLEVEFQEYGVLPPLDFEVELSMYRMIQELVQNALKHARATALLVQLSCAQTFLNITIEDNGNGLATLDNKNKYGLQNIKRRVEALKGQFDLKSNPGTGTTIYMEFDVRCFPEAHMIE